MRKILSRVRLFYGDSPLHLLALLACLALAGYVAVHTAADSSWPLITVWFLGALVVHDLVLFPLYALADRSLKGAASALYMRRPPTVRRISPLNYLRVPALGTALTFLLFFPGIIKQGQATYQAATGHTQQPFLGRWLLLTAAMFGLSAIAYAARLALDASRRG